MLAAWRKREQASKLPHSIRWRALHYHRGLRLAKRLECAGRAQRRRRFGSPPDDGGNAELMGDRSAESKAAWRFDSLASRRTPKRCRAVPPLKTRSWSQSVRQAKGGPTHESPIPFAIPLCMKKYSVRRVGLGARNLFRYGG